MDMCRLADYDLMSWSPFEFDLSIEILEQDEELDQDIAAKVAVTQLEIKKLQNTESQRSRGCSTQLHKNLQNTAQYQSSKTQSLKDQEAAAHNCIKKTCKIKFHTNQTNSQIFVEIY